MYLGLCVYYLHMFVYYVCSWSPQRPEDDVRPSGRVIMMVVSYHVGARNRNWDLWKNI